MILAWELVGSDRYLVAALCFIGMAACLAMAISLFLHKIDRRKMELARKNRKESIVLTIILGLFIPVPIDRHDWVGHKTVAILLLLTFAGICLAGMILSFI